MDARNEHHDTFFPFLFFAAPENASVTYNEARYVSRGISGKNIDFPVHFARTLIIVRKNIDEHFTVYGGNVTSERIARMSNANRL